MHSHPIQRRGAMALIATTAVLPAWVAAQNFPSRPITIVVPYPPGGTTDVLARALQNPLQKLLGQPVIVENRPGASAMLGAKLVARAPADGYTLLFPNNGLVISPHITKDAGYAPLTDFAPVSLVSLQPMVLVVNPSVPARTLPEFIAYARANPGKINYASAGPASFGHLATVQFARAAGLALEHIPYKGQAPTTQAVLSGEVQMLLSTSSAQMNAFIQEGRVRLLGVSSAQPSPLVPGGMPIAQTLPNFQADVWFGLFAPAATPKDVVARLNDAIGKSLEQPELRARFETAGGQPVASTPEQLKVRITHESEGWATIIKEANIKAE